MKKYILALIISLGFSHSLMICQTGDTGDEINLGSVLS